MKLAASIPLQAIGHAIVNSRVITASLLLFYEASQAKANTTQKTQEENGNQT